MWDGTTTELARRIRVHSLRMCAVARASHIGSCLSVADILAVLYGVYLRVDAANPQWRDRDRLIISKGHAAAAVYAVLAELGFIPVKELDEYGQDGSRLLGHVSHHVPGVELSTGSLGHGLSVGCGLALSAKRDARPWRTCVVMSDGELDEGSVWEAAMFAGHHRLDGLTVVVDYNGIQSFGQVKDVLDLEPLANKWRAFGWSVEETPGHDCQGIWQALMRLSRGKPKVIIARTVKGKGVPRMEGQLEWHYRSPAVEDVGSVV